MIEGESAPADRTLCWEHEGNRAIRQGNWKLVRLANSPEGWELYDIDRDRAEQHDLASQEPERVKQMTAQWEAWAKRAGAIPWIWQPQCMQRHRSPRLMPIRPPLAGPVPV